MAEKHEKSSLTCGDRLYLKIALQVKKLSQTHRLDHILLTPTTFKL